MLTIYHNPRCRKSREGLALLEQSEQDFEIFEYLKEPISTTKLKKLLLALKLRPMEIIRTGEKLYKNKYKGKKLTDMQWISVLCKNPILIERPIVVKGKQAVVGRPPEKIKELL